MIGTIVDYDDSWMKVLSGERLFNIEKDNIEVQLGQDYEFEPEQINVIEIKKAT
jgi:hypothetical protein